MAVRRESCPGPLVSVVLTTRDRPRLLAVALACYRHQTYPHRELIVVDDGDTFPADAAAVAAAGGRLIRVEPGTPLGTKLNLGVAEARGPLCQKMDDDDWYGPRFLERMVSTFWASWQDACRPTLAYLRPFLFFDLPRWEVRRSGEINAPGATLLFQRDSWEERPFRGVATDEDVWFMIDQMALGVTRLPVRALEQYLAVRHHGIGAERGHTWTLQWNGLTLEEFLLGLPLYEGGPEAILPYWAVEAYRTLRSS
jgi:glycosyltransferase involved in cell wall biosynthesis